MESVVQYKGYEYEVDVPVKYILWTRPDCIKKGFDVIKKARPSVLFLVSDGPRNDEERKLIEESRKIVENIDWNCTVHKLYYDENHGMYAMMKKTGNYIFNIVDRCIILEDDNIPSISFFRFCEEMLEKYKDDQRIGIINGYNHLGVYENVNDDYFFSKEGCIYGFAVWKRSYLPFLNEDWDFINDQYITSLVLKNAKGYSDFQKRIQYKLSNKLYEGHIAGEEFYQTYLVFLQNQLYIIPKKNMISNIGCMSQGAHTVGWKELDSATKKIYCTRTYELEFTLKHPKYVVPDTIYEKKRNRMMAQGYPCIFLYRKMVRALKMLIYGDWATVKKKIIHKISTRDVNNIIEK